MSSRKLKELVLPLGDLPENALPQRSAGNTSKRKPSKIKQSIEECDWDAYEAEVLALFTKAVEKYQREASSEKIYQISIWTDPQVQTSVINFETKAHAQEHITKRAHIFRVKYNDTETAERLEEAGYNDNPADFKYNVFLERKHPTLNGLENLNYSYQTHRHAADLRISASLRKVVKWIRQSDALAAMPREEEVWIGVSSPHDWYDHVIKV